MGTEVISYNGKTLEQMDVREYQNWLRHRKSLGLDLPSKTPAKFSAYDFSDIYKDCLIGETIYPEVSKTQVGGDHYTKLTIQPMEYSMKNGLDPCQHTIIKYVTRFRDKGGLQDLEKARHCLDLLIQFEKEKQNDA